MALRVTSNICIVAGENTHPQDAAAYLISSSGKSALIDTGTGKSRPTVIENIRQAGSDLRSIEYIFLTHSHFDHTGGALQLKDDTGALIVAHESDAPYIVNGDSEVTAASWYGEEMKKTPVDIIVQGSGGTFQLGDIQIEAIHAPGHTPGSMVLTTVSDGFKVLFGQDVHGPLHPALKSDRADYIATLKLLISIEADILCEGHYGIITGREKVREFISSFLN